MEPRAVHEASGDSEAASTPGGAPRPRLLKRRSSDFANTEQVPDTVSMEATKAQKKMEMLQLLKDNITKAQEADIWVAKTSGAFRNQRSVHYWVDQTVQALAELSEESKGKSNEKVVRVIIGKFMGFLTSLATQAPTLARPRATPHPAALSRPRASA